MRPSSLRAFSAQPAAPISSKPASAASIGLACRALLASAPARDAERKEGAGAAERIADGLVLGDGLRQQLDRRRRRRPRLRRRARDSGRSAGSPSDVRASARPAPTSIQHRPRLVQAAELEQRLDILGEVERRRRAAVRSSVSFDRGESLDRPSRLADPGIERGQQRCRGAIEGERRLDFRMDERSLGQLPREIHVPLNRCHARDRHEYRRCVRKLLPAVLVGELALPLSVSPRERQPAGPLVDDARDKREGRRSRRRRARLTAANSERISRASSSQPDQVRT